MKSSRSQSSKNVRRNARRLLSDSSDDSDGGDSSINVDSARAEKLFARRRPQKTSTSSLATSSGKPAKAEKTLFNVSDSESSLSSADSNQDDKSIDERSSSNVMDQTADEKINDSNSCGNSIDQSLFQPSKNDKLKYRYALQSSDDEQSKSSYLSVSNDSYGSKKNSVTLESDQCGDDVVIEEVVDKSSNQSSENITASESFFITPRKLQNRQKAALISSDESDIEQASKNSINNETNIILESESDDDIINSSNELCPQEKSKIETKLKNMSLIETSDSDNDSVAHYKSTIASSNDNRPFFEDFKFSNMNHSSHNPICQSSILENSSLENYTENVSIIHKNNKSIEVITLDNDSPKHHPTTIDLTKNEYGNLKKDSKSSVIHGDLNKIKLEEITSRHPLTIDLTKNEYDYSQKDSKSSVISGNLESLKMEKIKLEEITRRYTNNIQTMKNTMGITNLHKLPDGGLKLKSAILKEESALKDTMLQLNNVIKKLKEFPEESKMPSPFNKISPSKPSNVNSALIKEAAANVDVRAMGDKALSTYRTQQTMTIDVLHRLHKSLDTCPDPNTLSNDPHGLKVELMPHQKYAISWLLWREKQKPHGGVLADDMGLGKTLTMVSLILKATEISKDTEEDNSDESSDDSHSKIIRGGTLIICPSSLISQWQQEIKNKVRPGLLNVVQHYGPNRESSPRRLARKDIVITTYHVVMWDQKNPRNTSPIFQIKWNRIILDEGHTIRNYKSQTSIAVCSLKSVNRWVLSGTPIHNKEADFYALLKFIKCQPFDDWAIWKRWVGNNDEAGKNRLSLLVRTLMLRRTKAELTESTSFKLPSKTFHTVNVELFKEEKEAYEKVLLFSSSLFASYLYEKAEKLNAVERGYPVKNKAQYLQRQKIDDNIFKDHPELDKLFKQLMNNKDIKAHHILVLLLRLRQLCCHPCLMKNMLEAETLKVDGIQDTDDLDLVDHMSRMSIGVPSVKEQTLTDSNPIFEDSWVSSKIKAVCDIVKEKVLHTDDKAIIVSQWPSMLHLIGKQLSNFRIKTDLFSGSVPVPIRNKLVEEFNSAKGGAKILLLSLTAGGVGLNLVAANHLFLVDIHWNPQLEAQACDRIYRVGQKKPVNIYKFICTNTIESSIQLIQAHKLTIANNLFGGCKNVEGSKITLEDLKQIFQINPSK